MAAALVDEAMDETPVTFSLYVRELPPDRGYLVSAGLEDVLALLDEFRFTEADLDALRAATDLDDAFLDRLAGVRFTGHVRAVPEGRLLFADEPLLEVEAPFLVAQLLETVLLNQVTVSVTLATKAARCVHAARGRTLVDFALRRAHGSDAGMKASRGAAIVGFAATSNVAAAARYGLRATGTMAHSFVQAHASETDAFRAFARRWGDATVLLVDTYDTLEGIDRAIEVAREMRDRGDALRAIRLDSGDLDSLAREARARLDRAGLAHVTIFASGGLDEHAIARLVGREAPIDGFGVGSHFGVSSDAPVLDSVYKLVSVAGRPVRKQSIGKATLPGPKQVWRTEREGVFAGDVLGLAGEEASEPEAEPLLVEVVGRGTRTPAGRATLDDARAAFARDWERLAEPHKALTTPSPYPVRISPRLEELTRSLDATRF